MVEDQQQCADQRQGRVEPDADTDVAQLRDGGERQHAFELGLADGHDRPEENPSHPGPRDDGQQWEGGEHVVGHHLEHNSDQGIGGHLDLHAGQQRRSSRWGVAVGVG